MRRLIWILGAVALLWSVCWIVAALWIKNNFADWLHQQATLGWDMQLVDFGVGGYPTRFAGHAASLRILDQPTGMQLSSDAISLRVPAWWPGYVTLVLPGERVSLSFGHQEVDLAVKDAQARIRVKPGTALQLESAGLESGPWDLQSGMLQLLSGTQVQASFTQEEADPTRYAVEVNLTGVALGDEPRTQLRIPQDWPNQLATSTVNGKMHFSAPLNRNALEGVAPLITRMELKDLSVVWGPVEMLAKGAVDVDETGLLEGDFQVVMRNWQELLEITRAHDTALALQTDLMLNALANMGGDRETLDVTLTFENGEMSLGGIAIGPSPRITLN